MKRSGRKEKDQNDGTRHPFCVTNKLHFFSGSPAFLLLTPNLWIQPQIRTGTHHAVKNNTCIWNTNVEPTCKQKKALLTGWATSPAGLRIQPPGAILTLAFL